MKSVDHIILHVDMDAFFAAIEQRDHPELKGCPVIVGAPPDKRGVVSTASYEARRFGVHSAMPSRTAFNLCPQGIFRPVRMKHYTEVSAQLMQLFRKVTPIVEPVSVDEAFLDVTGVLKFWPDPVALARHVKQQIRHELGLTASVGIAGNKFLAKMASDFDKPDGLTVVPMDSDGIRTFLAPLPVTHIWGVGPKTGDQLAKFGIRKISQIQAKSISDMAALLGPTLGCHIWQLARGRDDRPVVAEKREEKSISNEETFLEDCQDGQVVRQTLITLVEKVGRRLRHARKLAGVGQIKLRFGDFRTITRQRSFPQPVCSDRDLLGSALALYDREKISQPIRLIGFGVSGLVSADHAGKGTQLLLFEEPVSEEVKRNDELDNAVDRLREKYGSGILKRGDWRL